MEAWQTICQGVTDHLLGRATRPWVELHNGNPVYERLPPSSQVVGRRLVQGCWRVGIRVDSVGAKHVHVHLSTTPVVP